MTELSVAIPMQSDVCQPFLIFGGAFRGRLVRLTGTVSEILRRHGDPAPVAALLAEALVAAAALAGGLKYEGVFSLQIQSDAPVHMLVADVTSAGGLRACIKFDPARLAAELEHPRLEGFAPRLLGPGHLAFTVDQGADTERYQGIVELCGGSLAESIHHYFRQSEQLASVLKVAVVCDDPVAEKWKAGAVLLQRMPHEGGVQSAAMVDDLEDAWRTAVILLGSLKDEELLDTALSPDRLLGRLYGTAGLRSLAPRGLSAVCRCSAERSVRILASFPAEEISPLANDGVVSMTCEFCREVYNFSLAEIAAAVERER